MRNYIFKKIIINIFIYIYKIKMYCNQCKKMLDQENFELKKDNETYYTRCITCRSKFNKYQKNKYAKTCSRQTLCNNIDCKDCYNKSFASYEGKTENGKLKIECWHEDNELKPREVFKKSKYIGCFDCDNCPHKFYKSLNTITNTNNNSWCPYCSKQSHYICDDNDCLYCLYKSFKTDYRSKFFNKELNNNLKPRYIYKNTTKKFWFKCNKCNYDFDITIQDKAWCPICKIINSNIFKNIINKWKKQIFKDENNNIILDVIDIDFKNNNTNIYINLTKKQEKYLLKNELMIKYAIKTLYNKKFYKFRFCYNKILNKYINFHNKIFYKFINNVKDKYINDENDFYNLENNKLLQISNYNIVKKYFNIKNIQNGYIYVMIKKNIDFIDILTKINNISKTRKLIDYEDEILYRTFKKNNITIEDIYNKTGFCNYKYNNYKLTFLTTKYKNIHNFFIKYKNIWNRLYPNQYYEYWRFKSINNFNKSFFKDFFNYIEDKYKIEEKKDYYKLLNKYKGIDDFFKKNNGSKLIRNRILNKLKYNKYDLFEIYSSFNNFEYWKMNSNMLGINNIIRKEQSIKWFISNINKKCSKKNIIRYILNTNFLKNNKGGFIYEFYKRKIIKIVCELFNKDNDLTEYLKFKINEDEYNKYKISSHIYKIIKIIENEDFKKYLLNNHNISNIKIVYEKKFKDCKLKRELPFDIYIKYIINNQKKKVLIEVDGEYHFKNSSAHNENDMKYQHKRDIIKTNYCKEKKIPLLRIHHLDIDGLNELSNIDKLKELIINFLTEFNNIKLSRNEGYEFLKQDINDIKIIYPKKYGQKKKSKYFILKRKYNNKYKYTYKYLEKIDGKYKISGKRKINIDYNNYTYEETFDYSIADRLLLLFNINNFNEILDEKYYINYKNIINEYEECNNDINIFNIKYKLDRYII